MLNRAIPPVYQKIMPPVYTFPQKEEADIPFFSLNYPQFAFVQLEMVIDAGKKYENYPGLSFFASNMLKKGVKGSNQLDIARYIDFYGAEIDIWSEHDFVKVRLLTLHSYYHKMLSLVKALLQTPTFNEKEFFLLKKRVKNEISIDEQKNDYVAQRKIFSLLFGKQHAYAQYVDKQNIDFIALKDIKNFFNNYFHQINSVFLVGNIKTSLIKHTQKFLSTFFPSKKQISYIIPKIEPQKIYIAKKNSLQTSLIIGKILVPQHHKDYMLLLILNTLLGGYFGSRLNQTLREKKGYTYGIYTQIVNFCATTLLLIKTDVLKEMRIKALEAIYSEIAKLQQKMVTLQELNQVKNWLLGNLLIKANGPLALINLFTKMHIYGLKQDYYINLYNSICTVQPQDIMHIAQKYFNLDTFNEVAVG